MPIYARETKMLLGVIILLLFLGWLQFSKTSKDVEHKFKIGDRVTLTDTGFKGCIGIVTGVINDSKNYHVYFECLGRKMTVYIPENQVAPSQ